ncbi:uncharacterized protein [Diadema antillarum]|uniref:uncharacterized protein n=1 Tax=Diadema antillarum TaxID=105358 RepID=UPI003A86E537
MSSRSEQGGTQEQNASSAMECTLLLRNKETMMTELRDVVSKGAIFVYFKLDFNSTFTMYSNSSYVVDPLTWVWAVDGKGKLLLTYPFDFEQLSLTTLSYGVFHLNLTVAVPHNGCFQQADDRLKGQIMALFVSELMQSVKDTHIYAGKESLVCFERQLTSDKFYLIGVYGIPLCTYYVFQGSTAYDCWFGSDQFDSEPIRVRKHGWLRVIFSFGIFLAFFSPLAASFFIRKNPPVTINGELGLYMSLNSDLPLGLKHLLCFSFQDCRLIAAARWFIFVAAFMFIPFIPSIISDAVLGDSFSQRTAVAYQLLLDKGLVRFWIIFSNLIFVVMAIFFHFGFNYVSTYLEVEEVNRVYFSYMFEMPENICVPLETGSHHLSIFISTMWYRTQMAINPAVWIFSIREILKDLFGRCGGRGRVNAFFFIIFVLPFVPVAFLMLLALNSVPLVYIPHWCVAKCIYKLKMEKLAEIILGVISISLHVLLSVVGLIVVVFVFVAVFVYVAEVLGYTFIGFVLNANYYGPFLIVGLTFAGYVIKEVTTFYNTYRIFLKRVVEAAERVDSQLASTQSRHGTSDAESRKPISLRENQPFPVISLYLFKKMVAEYQPIHLEVGAIFLKLLVIAVVMAFGLSTIVSIDGIDDLPATVKLFTAVATAGAVPMLTSIMKSESGEEIEEAENAQNLKTFLKKHPHLYHKVHQCDDEMSLAGS